MEWYALETLVCLPTTAILIDLHGFVPRSNGEEREKHDKYGVANWRLTKALRNMEDAVGWSILEHAIGHMV
jgi:hypothetical protein